MTELIDRVAVLEARVTALELTGARGEVHQGNIEQRLGGIEDTLKWLVRLVIGALLLGVVTFMIKGGLHVP